MSEIRTWELRLDIYDSPAILSDKLLRGGISVSSLAREILFKAKLPMCHDRSIDLSLLPLGMLNFPEEVCMTKLYEKLQGPWYPVPWKVGPALRHAYRDQKRGELIRILMEPAEVRPGLYAIFTLRRDAWRLWLDAEEVLPDDVFKNKANRLYAVAFAAR